MQLLYEVCSYSWVNLYITFPETKTKKIKALKIEKPYGGQADFCGEKREYAKPNIEGAHRAESNDIKSL